MSLRRLLAGYLKVAFVSTTNGQVLFSAIKPPSSTKVNNRPLRSAALLQHEVIIVAAKTLLYQIMDLVVSVILSLTGLFLLPILAYNGLHWAHFMIRTVNDSFHDFTKSAAREGIRLYDGNKPWFNLEQEEQQRLTADGKHISFTNEEELRDFLARCHITRPWRLNNDLFDRLLSIYIWFLDACHLLSPISALNWRPASARLHHEHFRRYLSLKPPAIPLANGDYVFALDNFESPGHITNVIQLSRTSLTDVRKVALHRLVLKSVKMRSILSFRHGRLCWVPLSIRLGQVFGPDARLTEIALNEQDARNNPGFDGRLAASADHPVFDINDHVVECPIDLKQTSIYEAMSKMASQCLPRNRPLWRAVLFQPINDDVIVKIPRIEARSMVSSEHDVHRIESNSREVSNEASGCEPLEMLHFKANTISYLTIVAHHVMGDGVAMSCTFCNMMDFEPLQYPVQIPVPDKPWNTLKAPPFIIPGVKSAYPFLDFRVTHAKTTAKIGDNVEICRTDNLPVPPAYKVALFYIYHLLAGYIQFAKMTLLQIVIIPKSVSIFHPSVIREGKRRPDTGLKWNGAPSYISVADINQVRGALTNLAENPLSKFTINDVMIYCIAAAFGRLKNPNYILSIRESYRCRSKQDDHQTDDCDGDRPAARSLWLDSLLKYPHAEVPMKSTGDECWTPSRFQSLRQVINNGTVAPIYENLSVSIMMPMSVRTSLPTELDNFTSHSSLLVPLASFSDSQQQKKEDRNHAAAPMVLNSGGTRVEDLTIRLRQLVHVQRIMLDTKVNRIRVKSLAFTWFMTAISPKFLLRLLAERLSSTFQIILSNVTGPSNMGRLANRKCMAACTWSPSRGHMSCQITVLSAGNCISVSVCVDEGHIRDLFDADEDIPTFVKVEFPHLVAKMIVDEFQHFKSLVLEACHEKLKLQTSQLAPHL